LNDWFSSRWSQAHDQPGLPSNRYFSQGDPGPTRLGAVPVPAASPDLDTFFSPSGLVGLTANKNSAFFNEGAWQNNESINTPYFNYPSIFSPTTYGAGNFSLNPYINQYAYKLLWKWIQPFEFNYTTPPTYVYNNLYTEHPLEFDRIVERCYGDQAWVRSGNMQWKVTPVGKGLGQQVTALVVGEPSIQSADNVTFMIEVMFDQPIFVSGRTGVNVDEIGDILDANSDDVITLGNAGEFADHLRNQLAFTGYRSSGVANAPTLFKPYSNLTLRGQAVVSYRKTNYYQESNLVGDVE
jgi:hypothetical protein